MTTKLAKLGAIALAALLVSAGAAAAMPGNAGDTPADTHANDGDHGQADAEHANDSTNESGTDVKEMPNGEPAANASAHADGQRGPPTDMPAPVPDHVTEIHETIQQFLNGEIDDLGHALSELLGGDAADEGAQDGQQTADDHQNQTTTTTTDGGNTTTTTTASA